MFETNYMESQTQSFGEQRPPSVKRLKTRKNIEEAKYVLFERQFQGQENEVGLQEGLKEVLRDLKVANMNKLQK